MPFDDATDARLVRAAAGGDDEAFGRLVEKYAAKVAAICYSVTGDAEVSRDVAQEVFTEAFLSLRRLRSPAKVAAWLGRVARLKAVSWVRRRVRHREERSALEAETLAARGAQPGEDVSRQETRRRVLAAVRGLPRDYREVIVLRCLEEEAPGEICRVLGISLAAMDKRLSRAKSMLREVLGDLLETGAAGGPGKKAGGEKTGEEKAGEDKAGEDKEERDGEPRRGTRRSRVRQDE